MPRLDTSCRLARPANPISHNTVRQLLLWYAEDGASPQGMMPSIVLFAGEDGLIEFVIVDVET
jgi:hypothetical protein